MNSKPVSVTVTQISPKDAKKLLERVHPNQRGISEERVSHYAKIMLEKPRRGTQ